MEKYFQLEQELIHLRLLHQREMEGLKKGEEKEIQRMKEEFGRKFSESENIYSSSKN